MLTDITERKRVEEVSGKARKNTVPFSAMFVCDSQKIRVDAPCSHSRHPKALRMALNLRNPWVPRTTNCSHLLGQGSPCLHVFFFSIEAQNTGKRSRM